MFDVLWSRVAYIYIYIYLFISSYISMWRSHTMHGNEHIKVKVKMTHKTGSVIKWVSGKRERERVRENWKVEWLIS